jgi:short-chain fatty acids transporter
MKSKPKITILITPFGLVLILSALSIAAATVWSRDQSVSTLDLIRSAFGFWQNGFFGLLEFTLQMMIILVLGYAMAIYKPIYDGLKKLASYPNTQIQAVMLTAVITLISGLINWGFGLIVGAVLARFVAMAQKEKSNYVNPALLASAGYLGMAIWHGGFSASAPLKVAEKGHFLEEEIGIIPASETIFSPFNLMMTSGLILVFLSTLWFFSKKDKHESLQIDPKPIQPISTPKSFGLGSIVGLVILTVGLLSVFNSEVGIGTLNLNTINFLLFGISLFAFKSLSRFTEAVGEGIKSSVDIFIQFPFYAGILGVLAGAGLIEKISQLLLDNTSEAFVPLLIFFSAAFVNLLIPSGGGQWAIQGPILIEVGRSLNFPIGKLIMVFAYGDQISNLLQPFWALPLLAITGVSARQLLKYCIWLFLTGFGFLATAIFFFF